MANLGLDFAGAPPAPADILAAGYSFVCRYLSHYTPKTISKAEFDANRAAGVAVVLVFEDYANQALQGYAQGASDAQYALEQARAIGWPEDRPIYFAVDFDINDSQKPVAGEYMKGVQSVLGIGRTGAYGGYYWIKYCADNGLAAWYWQAVAWSGGQRDARAHLFQRLGGVTVGSTECDVDEALQSDFGQTGGETAEMSKIGEVELNDLYRAFMGPIERNPITDDDRKRWIDAETNTVIRQMEADPRHAAYLQYVADLEKAVQTPAAVPIPTPSTPEATPPAAPEVPAPDNTTPDQAQTLNGIAQAVQWIKDKLSSVFK